MTFELNVGATSRSVEYRGTELWVDGRRVDVDVVRAGHGWSLLIGHRSYEVSLVERGPDDLIVYVSGQPVSVTGGPGRFASRRAIQSSAAAAAAGAHRVVAPMPGRVAKVLVSVGETVAARQGLVIVEAMKMENELRSPRGGTVTEIRATEGALVEANTVLIVLE